MQATINSHQIPKFQPLIHELATYIIHGFTVIANRQTHFKPFDTKLKIIFQHKTMLTPCKSPSFHLYGLKFTGFSSIAQASNNNEFFYWY